jgi:hypothetical protein
MDRAPDQRLDDDLIRSPKKPSQYVTILLVDRDHFLVFAIRAAVIEFDHQSQIVKLCPALQEN